MKRGTFLNGRVSLWQGDCREVLQGFSADSVDAVVCDPPYHLTSIVKRFGADDAAPAKAGATGAYARASAGFMGKAWDGGDVAFRPETWAEVLRVMKPGAYLLAFASTRGFGRMSVAIEDAGFITHPFIAWVFATGFPKATRVKAEGYDGWRYGGQALKPAIEPIYMGQKPFEKGLSGTENVLKHGTGAINIDGCRIAGTGNKTFDRTAGNRPRDQYRTGTAVPGSQRPTDRGRWPANLIHDGSDEVLAGFPDSGGGKLAVSHHNTSLGSSGSGVYGKAGGFDGISNFGDSGSASRFFYSAKADKNDRLGSKHPTVKPLDLMQYLVRLVTPQGGTVLDPFAGTGTTGEAAWREGMRAILIEREDEYCRDIERRMALADAGPEARRAAIVPQEDPEDLPIFDALRAAE